MICIPACLTRRRGDERLRRAAPGRRSRCVDVEEELSAIEDRYAREFVSYAERFASAVQAAAADVGGSGRSRPAQSRRRSVELMVVEGRQGRILPFRRRRRTRTRTLGSRSRCRRSPQRRHSAADAARHCRRRRVRISREGRMMVVHQSAGTEVVPAVLYGVDEAATALRLSRSLIYELIRSGRLRSVKQGRRRLVPVSALDEYVASLESGSDDRAAGSRVRAACTGRGHGSDGLLPRTVG